MGTSQRGRAAIGDDIPVKRSKEALEGKILNSLGKAGDGWTVSVIQSLNDDGFWMIVDDFGCL